MSDETPRHDTPPPAPDHMAKVTEASRDAFKTFLQLFYNPVGALPGAYRSLPGQQALVVGLVFMGVWLIATMIGGALGVSGLGFPMRLGSVPFSYKVRAILVVISIPLGVTLGVFAARKIGRGVGDFAQDVFVAGAAMLMLGFATLLGGLLGKDVLQLSMLVAVTIAVLVIFTALTRLSNIAEGGAAYLTAAVFVIAAVVMRVMLAIVF